jgi:non-homologous end joining protein Ku
MEMNAWVQAQYRGTYCDKNGQLIPHKLNLDAFRESLKAQRPDEVREVMDAVKRQVDESAADPPER